MKDRNWSPVGGRRRGLRSFTARLTLRILAVASIIVMYHVLELHFRYREDMRLKYLPTVFGNLSEHDEAVLTSTEWQPNADMTNTERRALLDNRRHWKRLGKGHEGETFTFNNTVIKVYDEESSPFRNCMMDTGGPPRRWPTEIPASLVMGGHEGSSPPPGDGPNKEMFVPVKDYFLAAAAADPLLPPKWHLVTPFLKSGTLKNLAKKLRASGAAGIGPTSHRELDRAFRPSFESLLAALADLHAAQNLCHDDVKLDNVFVGSDSDLGRWKLGDLGNAREPDHPYHATALWTADTPQLRDCRANDALRLTRVYLQFLRRAGSDPGAFDEALFRGVEAFSRLYWAVARAAPAAVPATASQIALLSRAYPPPPPTGRDGEEPSSSLSSSWITKQQTPADVGGSRGWAPAAAEAVFGWRWSLASAVERELRVGAKEKAGKFWGATWLLGIPVGACQAA
ncbi:uncharacterized protein GLRG_06373 [Colletotrichum graminicola M1.001]|uniref:Protein kinase domain-containing protein n=1 Tax=Colletotrichum graminicola (strain M1.001 / M2 / FGSC 10212) TaxID=645133 RepID=E3QK41_COLGM|nr:uncharacterized protein GLRG_06373 [Colletotrichum graminicola M1.001]EFQ31229.1 hypothetical protein GLRG_06373 [Colletotrichum graminicola M1.001]